MTNEYIEDEEFEEEEEMQEIGNCFCPNNNCFSFAFLDHGGGILECEQCGALYRIDEDELPFISHEELINAKDN